MQREIVPDNFCTIHSWLVQGDSAGPWRPHPVLQSHRKVCLKCLLQLKSPTKAQHLIWIFLTSSYKHQWSYKLASGLSGWLLDLATKLLLRAKGTSGEAGQQLWNSCVWPPLDAQQEHRRSGLLLPWQEGTRAMVVRCFTCSHYMASCRCTLALAMELTEASSLQHTAIMLTRLLPLLRRNRKDLYIIQEAVLTERFWYSQGSK